MDPSIRPLIAAALSEDVGHGDVTSNALIPEDARCTVRLVAKQHGVLSGIGVYRATFETMAADIDGWQGKNDGDTLASSDIVASFQGSTRAVLAAERTALNFLQHLSGIATLTRSYVDAIGDLNCRVCDTRKTTPLLRSLEKKAVVHGGGTNHRHNLTDGILIKENHVAAAAGIEAAITRARSQAHHLTKVEVEVRNLDEFQEALSAGADVVMLDNMDNPTMVRAVALNKKLTGGRTVLEASGNVSLARIRAMAETGVDIISVGALTHSAPALDFSLLIEVSP
jgi:nicotinate-nucleotide pyrophosphorylase (carboxylating)